MAFLHGQKFRLTGRGETMTELKPCPFCGGEAVVKACDGSGSCYTDAGRIQYLGRPMTHKLIRCEKCGIRTGAYKTVRGVFNAWNRRTEGNNDNEN